MKIFAALLLHNYTWQLAEHQDLRLDSIPTLDPKSGLQVVNLSRI